MYKKKNAIYRWVMRRFGRKIINPTPFSEAYNRESAKAIKREVAVPVFLIGGLTTPRTMEEIIENGNANYISLSRALIADPNFPEKIRNGSREPSRCIHCNLCIGYLTKRPLRCYHGTKIRREGTKARSARRKS
jgi:2,4-dienoyl-CoA reductase-like NADH-dependent reductase (Old Yellow Enzyme family)